MCKHCGAVMWYEERLNKGTETKCPNFSMCCIEGRVKLPPFKEPPPYLGEMLNYKGGLQSTKFRENIRAYNSIFAFTSMGAQVDIEINKRPGPYVFRVSGQVYHLIGSLLPLSNSKHKFLQLYMYDDASEEVFSRIRSLGDNDSSRRLDETVTRKILETLNDNNCLAQAFRMARDRLKDEDSSKLEMRLLSNRQPQNKQYNLPTASEVAALIVGDFGFSDAGRDVLVENKKERCQQISESHPSFMALQYPLLFPYGEDGYHPNIKYNNDTSRKKIARQYVTMREYYAYCLQQRVNQGKTLLLGGRLFQQYIVDSYAAVEAERLAWVRKNSKHLEQRFTRIYVMPYAKGIQIAGQLGEE